MEVIFRQRLLLFRTQPSSSPFFSPLQHILTLDGVNKVGQELQLKRGWMTVISVCNRDNCTAQPTHLGPFDLDSR